MFSVFNSLATAHDMRFVALAATVCLVAGVAAVHLFNRARVTRGRARRYWLLTAGTATGFGIWATHFIAILAYDPGRAVAFDVPLTVLSLIAAIMVTGIGFAIAVEGSPPWAGPIGGALVGAAIAAMHFLGMAALQGAGDRQWAPDGVVTSVVLGMLFGSASLTVASRAKRTPGLLAAAVLLILAIVTHYFVAMGAVTILPDPTRIIEASALSSGTLAVAVALAALIAVGICLAVALIDGMSEQKLRGQNRKLDLALRNMSQGLSMFDRDGLLVLCNDRYLNMYNLSPDIVKPGMSFDDILALSKAQATFEEDPATFGVGNLSSARHDGDTSTVVRRSRVGDRIFSVVRRGLEEGGWLTTHDDITDLLAREDSFRLLFDNNPAPMWVYDNETFKIVGVNNAAVEQYGYSREQFSGLTLLDISEPQHHEAIRADASTPLGVERLGRVQRFKKADHSAIDAMTFSRSLSYGGRNCSLGLAIDVSERQRAQSDLRRAREFLSSVIENVPVGLIMRDMRDDAIVLLNRAGESLLGVGRESVLGKKLHEVVPSEMVDQIERRDAAAFESGTSPVIDDLAIDRPGLQPRRVRTRRVVVADDGQPRYVLVVLEDITEQKKREASFQLLFDANPLPMWVYDRDSLQFLAVNEAAILHYGYSRAQFLAMTLRDIRTPEDLERLAAALSGEFRADDGGKTWRHLTAAGSLIDVLVYRQSLPYEGRNGILAALIDVTERKGMEDELRRAGAFLDMIIDHVPAMIVVKSLPDRRYVLINREGEEYFGKPRDQLLGKTAREVFPEDRANVIDARDADVLASGRKDVFDDGSAMSITQNGRHFANRRLVINDSEGVPKYMLGVVQDVTERCVAQARIAHLAHHDPLTDLPNRAAFSENLGAVLERAAQAGDGFAVLCIDLDRFKEINDVFGHSTGDKFLCHMSRRLQEVAGGAFVARVGGDEFTLIVEGPQPATAEALAEQLMAIGSHEFEIEGRRFRAGLSIGVSVYPADGADAETLLANADAALYRAKADGRGTIRFFELNMDVRLRARRALQHDLQSAIERGEFVMHYQPQALIDGTVIGFEALLRWYHPARGLVPPSEFIPIAEESGLIIPISEWILRDVCREAASWPEPLQVAVNLSPVQFRHGDLAALVHGILLETGLAAARLEFEITEGVLIGDFSRAVSILRRLKALGVRIAMDDFGTGYSSLSYLQSFPFDKIKIDRSFISNLEHNVQSGTIVRAVIGLARGLHLPVVAEGVETEGQREFLAREACDEIQGYLIGRPSPIADFHHIIGRSAPVRRMPLAG